MVRFRSPFGNNKGFSLMELVVAAGISIVVGGVGSFILVLAVETYTRMVRQYEAESEMATAMLAVSSTLSNSQKMVLKGNVNANEEGPMNDTLTNRAATPNASYITRGYLMGAFDNSVMTGGSTHLIAMGITESGARTNRSNLTAFGIFHQRPSNTQSGAIYIDKERNPGGWTALSPINASQSFGRFTYFGVTDIRLRALDGSITVVSSSADAALLANRRRPVLSANFVFQMRYFTKGRTQDFFWCPSTNMNPTCIARSDLVHYRDVTKNLKVVFANQEMVDYTTNNSTFLAERMYGRVYFFKFLPSKK